MLVSPCFVLGLGLGLLVRLCLLRTKLQCAFTSHVWCPHCRASSFPIQQHVWAAHMYNTDGCHCCESGIACYCAHHVHVGFSWQGLLLMHVGAASFPAVCGAIYAIGGEAEEEGGRRACVACMYITTGSFMEGGAYLLYKGVGGGRLGH